ncbi:hypothetical protein [Brachybacterium sacelli]
MTRGSAVRTAFPGGHLGPRAADPGTNPSSLLASHRTHRVPWDCRANR